MKWAGDTVEPEDLVIHFGSEWTVHSVDDKGIALLRRHNDLNLTDNTLKVPASSLQPWVKAKDR